jgi:ribosomal protein S18 acetylase RimI-like enzyme
MYASYWLVRFNDCSIREREILPDYGSRQAASVYPWVGDPSLKDIVIRPAESADASVILTCLQAAFEDFRDAYTELAFLDTVMTPETILHRLDRMNVFVAVDGEKVVVGTVGFEIESGSAHIRGMAVLPELRGSGIAQKLLAHVEELVATRGCRQVRLETTAPLTRAIGFYERNGYQPTGRVTDFFGMELFEYCKTLPGAV